MSIPAKDLTIIIPIDLNFRYRDIITRVKNLVNNLSDSSYKVILGCNALPNTCFLELKQLVQQSHNIVLVSEDCIESHLSRLRNIALFQVKTPYVLFLDVDIHIDLDTLKMVREDIDISEDKLCMYPCLYLTKSGSKRIKKTQVTDFRQYYYQYRRDLILHLAFPSSIIVTDTQSIHAIQGFNEKYIGWGYEDMDFIIRLFKYKKLLTYCPQLLIDTPYRAPLLSQGFRAEIAKSQLQHLFKDKYFIHLFHKKDSKQRLYSHKEQNKIILRQELQNKCHQQYNDSNYFDLLDLFEHLTKQKNEDISKFSALWAEIPAYLFRENFTILKILRYLKNKFLL